MINIQVDHVSLDYTAVKVHPDGTGALKKRSSIYRQIPRRMDNQDSYGGGRTQPRRRITLSPGQPGDAPAGCKLLKALENCGGEGAKMIMDKAYEGNETRQLVFELGMDTVVPPNVNRLTPWEYERELYKTRNEAERLFRRLKGFRTIFSRFDKLDVVFKFCTNRRYLI